MELSFALCADVDCRSRRKENERWNLNRVRSAVEKLMNVDGNATMGSEVWNRRIGEEGKHETL